MNIPDGSQDTYSHSVGSFGDIGFSVYEQSSVGDGVGDDVYPGDMGRLLEAIQMSTDYPQPPPPPRAIVEIEEHRKRNLPPRFGPSAKQTKTLCDVPADQVWKSSNLPNVPAKGANKESKTKRKNYRKKDRRDEFTAHPQDMAPIIPLTFLFTKFDDKVMATIRRRMNAFEKWVRPLINALGDGMLLADPKWVYERAVFELHALMQFQHNAATFLKPQWESTSTADQDTVRALIAKICDYLPAFVESLERTHPDVCKRTARTSPLL
jgi:hypothetical protein